MKMKKEKLEKKSILMEREWFLRGVTGLAVSPQNENA